VKVKSEVVCGTVGPMCISNSSVSSCTTYTSSALVNLAPRAVPSSSSPDDAVHADDAACSSVRRLVVVEGVLLLLMMMLLRLLLLPLPLLLLLLLLLPLLLLLLLLLVIRWRCQHNRRRVQVVGHGRERAADVSISHRDVGLWIAHCGAGESPETVPSRRR
jgi:hypothetical protein